MSSARSTLLYCVPAASFALLVSLGAAPGQRNPATKAKPTGQRVYATQCASCHGAKGEGSKAYLKPLAGSKSVGELSRFIAESMPPGPRKCSASDSKLVADYIYNTFYS